MDERSRRGTFAFLPRIALAQNGSYERTFPQSKSSDREGPSLHAGSLAGHLPVLDGFAKPGDHPLDRYQRGYYQSTVQVISTRIRRIA